MYVWGDEKAFYIVSEKLKLNIMKEWFGNFYNILLTILYSIAFLISLFYMGSLKYTLISPKLNFSEGLISAIDNIFGLYVIASDFGSLFFVFKSKINYTKRITIAFSFVALTIIIRATISFLLN